jgi:hypothetical protein
MMFGDAADKDVRERWRGHSYNNQGNKVIKMLGKNTDNHNFDINVGHLVKSPCKECEIRESFPSCIDDCQILEQIQSALSESMSTANNYSVAETFDVPMHVLEQL